MDDNDACRAGSGFRRREEGQHTSSRVRTFVEVIKVSVESALQTFYPRIKGIRGSANFIRNIVSKYLAARPGTVSYRRDTRGTAVPPYPTWPTAPLYNFRAAPL